MPFVSQFWFQDVHQSFSDSELLTLAFFSFMCCCWSFIVSVHGLEFKTSECTYFNYNIGCHYIESENASTELENAISFVEEKGVKWVPMMLWGGFCLGRRVRRGMWCRMAWNACIFHQRRSLSLCWHTYVLHLSKTCWHLLDLLIVQYATLPSPLGEASAWTVTGLLLS